MRPKWLQEDREVLKMLKDMDIGELLVLVTKYNNKSILNFMIEITTMEISHYRDNLRFARWVKRRRMNVTNDS